MTNQRWLWLGARLGIVASVWLGVQPACEADARLDVQVLDERTGAPLEGVGVCLGTAAEPGQIGMLRSDAAGRVVFRSIPTSALQLVLSRSGYVSQKRVIEPLYESSTLVLKLAAGWQAGPHCLVSDRTGSGGERGLAITDLDLTLVSAASRAVRIGVRTQGSPEQIRVSEREDFRDAQWQPYQPEVRLVLGPGKNRTQVFVQVRRTASLEGASIQTLSPVRSVAVTVP